MVAGLVTLLALAGRQPAAAQSSDPYYLIDLVNQLRAEYGLPPYRIDPALMAAAQAHSEWAASVGTHSHTGAGGSTPTDRAIAAGYGGGKPVRVSENIYWGTLATPQSAIEWWRNSTIHFRGMTSTTYTDIGAGVAYSAAGGFFTLNFGLISGEAPPPAPASPQQAQPAPAPIIEPIERAEPNEDGSIIHTVGAGQSLWAIADAYDVPLSEILALNRLTENAIIRPGDQIVIVPAPIRADSQPQGPIIHIVEPGQTLFGIALTYGVDLETILALNGLSTDSLIFPGDQILIRPAEATSMPPPTFTPRPTPGLTPHLTPAVVAATAMPQEPMPPPKPIGGRQIATGILTVVGLVGVTLIIIGLTSKPGSDR